MSRFDDVIKLKYQFEFFTYIIDEIYNNLIYKNKIKYYYNYVKKYLSEVSNGKI